MARRTLYGSGAGSGGGGTTLARAQAIYVGVDNLADGDSALVSIDLGWDFRLYTIAASWPARVRLYSSLASQTADEDRLVDDPPASDAGVILDYVLALGQTVYTLSPIVDGALLDATVLAVPLTVTNLSGSTHMINVAFDYLQLQAAPLL